jgi:hypothetical protein
MGPGVVALDLVPGKAGGLFAESGDEVRCVLYTGHHTTPFAW